MRVNNGTTLRSLSKQEMTHDQRLTAHQQRIALTNNMVEDPVMAKTVQINSISPYHAVVCRSGMGLGPKNLAHMDGDGGSALVTLSTFSKRGAGGLPPGGGDGGVVVKLRNPLRGSQRPDFAGLDATASPIPFEKGLLSNEELLITPLVPIETSNMLLLDDDARG